MSNPHGMRMEFSQRLDLRQKLDLRQIPALIQAIEILQYPSLELAAYLKKELERNPALELASGEHFESPLTDVGREVDPSADLMLDGVKRESRPDAESQDDFARLERLLREQRGLRDAIGEQPIRRMAGGPDKKYEAMQNTAAKKESLREHLEEQLRGLDLEPYQQELAEAIVGEIDDNGYLRTHLNTLMAGMPGTFAIPSWPEGDADALSWQGHWLVSREDEALDQDDSDAYDDDDAGEDDAESSADTETDATASAAISDGEAVDGRPSMSEELERITQRTGTVFSPANEAETEEMRTVYPRVASSLPVLQPSTHAQDIGEVDDAEKEKKTKKRKRRRRQTFGEPSTQIPLEAPKPETFGRPDTDYFADLIAEGEEVLGIIRSLDPPGVGAYTLTECLELQMTPDMPQAALAGRLLDGYLEDVAKKRFAHLASELGATETAIEEAVHTISQCTPRPGAAFTPEPTAYIVPDVFVTKVVDEDNPDEYYLDISVDDRFIPALRVSDAFRRFTGKKRDADSGEWKRDDKALKDLPTDAKQFARQNVADAQRILQSIEARRATLLNVARAIIDRQHAFFDEGIAGLVPLKMQEIADELNVHVSTISRAVSDKFMDTPLGIFPMKFFFRGGTQSKDGEDVSTEMVKERVRQVIEGEDKGKPLSDLHIAEALSKEFGLEIARRTVTKYRKQLNIPSSRERGK